MLCGALYRCVCVLHRQGNNRLLKQVAQNIQPVEFHVFGVFISSAPHPRRTAPNGACNQTPLPPGGIQTEIPPHARYNIFMRMIDSVETIIKQSRLQMFSLV